MEVPILGWKQLVGFCDPIAPVASSTHCGFESFITLFKNGITDLVLLSTLLAMVVLLWAAFLWLTSQGDTGKHKKALDMLWKVVMGYVWILAAWVIVYTITSTLVKPEFNFLLEGTK